MKRHVTLQFAGILRLGATLLTAGWVPENVAADVDPVLVGQWPPFRAAVDVAVRDGYAFVVDTYAGLQAVDIRDPARPRWLAACDTRAAARAVAVSGHYAYVLDVETLTTSAKGEGLVVVDIQDPTQPRRVAAFDFDAAPTALAVSGDYACVTMGASGLAILDLRDPAQPQQAGRCALSGTAAAVAISDAYAYVAGQAGLEVIAVGDPRNPRRVGGCAIAGGSASDVAVSGQHAYVAAGNLVVLDLSDPANPQRVGSLPHSASSLTVSGNYVYAPGSAGMQVIEVADPANPKLVATQSAPWPFFANPAVTLSGNTLCVAAGVLVMFDLGDPALPRQVNWAVKSATPHDAAVSEGHVYLAAGEAGLQVLDIRNPARPEGIGGCDTVGSAVGVVVAGGYAYVAEQRRMNAPGGLQVVSLEDPFHPQPRGRCDLGQDVMEVAIAGQYAFVVCESIGLQVVDTSNPAEPRHVGGDSSPERGTRSAVALLGEHAYVATGWGLEVFDIRDPLQTKRVGSERTYAARDVAVAGDDVCVANESGPGFGILGIRDPTTPQPLGQLELAAPASAVAVSGDHAYVTDRQGDVYVISIRDPLRPERVGRYRAGGVPAGLVVMDNLACFGVSRGIEGIAMESWFEVIEPLNPALLEPLGSHPGDAVRAVAAAGAMVAAGNGRQLEVVDVSDPARPQRVGLAALLEDGGDGEDVVWSGGYAYVATSGGRLQVVDLREPAQPQRVGECPTSGLARGVAVAGAHAYVANAGGVGLQVIDISNPTKPVVIGGYDWDGDALDVAVTADYAYVAGSWEEPGFGFRDGLMVFDLRSPTNPEIIARFETARGRAALGGIHNANGVALTGTHACIAAGRKGLYVVDISDPRDPQPAGNCATKGSAQGVVVWERHAYVASDYAGVEVIDLRDPATPLRVGGSSAFDALAVTVDGTRAFVATESQGLVILPTVAPSLRLGTLWLGSGGEVHVVISGPVGAVTRVQRSADLRAWEDWRTLTLGTQPVQVEDPDSVAINRRFYRAVGE